MRLDLPGLCFINAGGLHFTHASLLAALSFAVAALGACASPGIPERLRHASGWAARFWLLGAAAALGGSIWAMHFLAVLGLRVDLPLGYDSVLTAASLVLAGAVVAGGLACARGAAPSQWCLAAAGVLSGVGIATTYCLGMAALRLPGAIAYGPPPWAASVAVAIAAAVALRVSTMMRPGRRRVIAALSLAAGSVGMHHTAMAANVISYDPGAAAAGGAVTPLAGGVAGVTVAVVLLALVSAQADRRLSRVSARDAEALRRANAELEAVRREIMHRLRAAGEFRDDETAAHAKRMAAIVHRLALRAGCDAAYADILCQAAPLHDIGKLGIRDAVLLKPGRLTAQERREMERHAEIGARILSGSGLRLLDLAAEIARSHHERWDGTGYPDRRAGTDIPFPSRVVAIADVFDALLSRRPYKEPWTLDQTTTHLRREAGRHFDPRLTQVFLDDLPAMAAIWCEHSGRTATPAAPAGSSLPAMEQAAAARPA